MSDGETLVIVAIVAVFAVFMIMLAWGDRHTRGSRGRWD
jgi:hypothetical protein